MQFPESVGVMVLPNAVLFPQALLPLYIFEPRYREMLSHALENQRMFALALNSPEMSPRPVAGLGLIRACVHNADGTSNLVLQGIARVRFTGYLQTEPYYVGRIEPLLSLRDDSTETQGLAKKILELVMRTRMQNQQVPDWLMQFLEELKDLDVLADLVTYTFVEDTPTKQQILEELHAGRRLRKLWEALQAQTP